MGAFAFANGSRDAALMARLSPGAYTIHNAGAPSSAAGEVLAELYATP